MPSTAQSKRLLRFLPALVLELLSGVAITVRSEQLPIKTYTTADGLVRDDVNQIFRDSRGFLWFSTNEGLSRFDGYKFTNYAMQDGLPSRRVNAVLETRDGTYWVATGDGVCRFNSAGEDLSTQSPELKARLAPMFICYRPRAELWSANVLFEDRAGVIWCGAGNGLYRLEANGDSWQLNPSDLKLPNETPDDRIVEAIVGDRQGALWVGTRGSGLYQRLPDGHSNRYTVSEGLPSNRVNSLLTDKDDHLWVGTMAGLSEIPVKSGSKRASVARTYTTKDGLAANWTYAVFQTSQGQMWVASPGGLSKLMTTIKKETRFLSYTEANGLGRADVVSLGEDRDGNLWIGTNGSGALKLAHDGFTTFNKSDGLTLVGVHSIFENQARQLCIISLIATSLLLEQFDGARFNDITPRFPKEITYFGWGWNQYGLQDRAGEWWLPTGHGLCRFPRVSDTAQLAHMPPRKIYTSKDGLPLENIFRLFEDSHGNIWISTTSAARNGLTIWDRNTEKLRTFSSTDGLPNEHFAATSFVEDGAGTIWIGTNGSRLLRFREGRFDSFTTADGIPTGWLRALYIDHAGRLWIAASTGGLARIDNSLAERPTLVSMTTADGLSSNELYCITEDVRGRIYVGNGRGVDRIDPQNRNIKHYSAADGLFRGPVETAYRDRTGALWFGSPRGLARFLPESEESTPLAPPIFINSIHIAGESVRVELGATEISGLELGANRNQIQIDFVGLDFGTGETLRYQYKLEGADTDWSAPTDQRSINFARLPSGDYRFLVRATDSEGNISPRPAIVAFRIFPPFYRRWWFIGLTTVFVVGFAYGAYRYRLAQLLALERMRTRIATDLHDDIGSNLSLIAGLSELLRQQMRRLDTEQSRQLSLIANASRKSVDAMSDIVWAVNPQKDHLQHLTRRMRRFASDTFTARDIRFNFAAPVVDFDRRLDAQTRREVFLIFKEAVNNIARHSNCAAAEITLAIERGQLRLLLRDDGNGFAIETADEGQGLTSMRKRAAKIGGELFVSSTDDGTTVVLKAPLRHSRLG